MIQNFNLGSFEIIENFEIIEKICNFHYVSQLE